MGFANSFVHILMYTYYAMAAAGVRGQLFTWLKRSITKVQMTQFVLMIAHSLQTLFNGCNIPKWIVYSNAGHGLLFLALFANFYRSRYVSQSGAKAAPKEAYCSHPHHHGA